MEQKKDINIIDTDSFAFPKAVVKDDDENIGYLFDANDVKKIQYIEMIINDDNYPIDHLPKELQELVLSARRLRDNRDDSISHHR